MCLCVCVCVLFETYTNELGYANVAEVNGKNNNSNYAQTDKTYKKRDKMFAVRV